MEVLTIYAEEYIPVIDKNKFSKEYLPRYYYVDNLRKNSKKAFNLKEITYIEKRIIKVARFKFYENKKLVRVVKQIGTTITGCPCIYKYNIKGKWPEGVKREHRHE